jgi:guanylate kinase
MDRGTENPESMAKRLERARYELDQAHLFDFVLHNIDLVQAEAQLMALMDQVVKNKAS